MSLLYRVRFTLNGWVGAPGLSTTYHLCAAPPTLSGAQAASDRVRGAWDVVKTIFPNSFTSTPQAAVDVIDDADGSLFSSFGITPLGTVTGTLVTTGGPTQVMAGLILNTNTVVDGRRLRGRLNIGPLASTMANQPSPPGGVVTAVNAFGVALVTVSPPAATAPVRVWHRPVRNSSGVITRLGSSSDVVSSQIAGKWFTLRSRLN